MFEFIKFLKKRPSDKTILAIRFIFGFVLVATLYYNFFVQEGANEIESTMLFWNVDTSSFKEILKYVITALWLFPILFAVLNLSGICVAKKKIIRIIQVVFAILIWYSAALVINTENLDINELLILAWFLPFFAGVTGKCIVSTCLKYGEKIQKIRV